MRRSPVAAALLSVCAAGVTLVACSDGSSSLAQSSSLGSPGGTGAVVGTSGSSGVSGVGVTTGGSAGSTSSGASGAAGNSDGGAFGSGGASGGASGGGGASGAANVDPYSGPFKILVLSKTLGFHHDSIPACQQMLRELGTCVDAASCTMAGLGDSPINGAKPNSSFTVDVAGAPATGCPTIASSGPNASDNGYTTYNSMGCDGSTSDLSQFSATNLDTNQFSSLTAPQGPYQMIFFCSPTGTDFTSGGPNGAAGMTAIQSFITAGGAYGGVHSAPDFENSEMWQFYYNDLMGAWFKDHNNDGTPGTVNTVPMYANHPVMRGIPSPWNTQDEWYLENREISSQPGFQILATLSGVPALAGEPANDIRPIIWIKQFPVASDPTMTFEGRSFYTVRGHNITRYGEAPFRQLIHQGILWATHRLN